MPPPLYLLPLPNMKSAPLKIGGFALTTFTCLASIAEAQFIALDSPAPLTGNQGYGGSLGMEFNVGLTPIQITRVGAFDSAQDGYANTINVRVYDRLDVSTPILSESLAAGATGTPINGSRFITPSTIL